MIFKHILDLFLCVSREKTKAEGASGTTPAGVETRLDKSKAERTVAAEIAVHKHRASQHPNKKRAVLVTWINGGVIITEKRQKAILCCRPGGSRQFRLKCCFSPRTVPIQPKGHSRGLLGGSGVEFMPREKSLRSFSRALSSRLIRKRNKS